VAVHLDKAHNSASPKDRYYQKAAIIFRITKSGGVFARIHGIYVPEEKREGTRRASVTTGQSQEQSYHAAVHVNEWNPCPRLTEGRAINQLKLDGCVQQSGVAGRCLN
jgi:hypothetical protein